MSQFQRKKKKSDDDDISFLSYSTPVISNTFKSKASSRKKDDHSDVTPIISNRENVMLKTSASGLGSESGSASVSASFVPKYNDFARDNDALVSLTDDNNEDDNGPGPEINNGDSGSGEEPDSSSLINQNQGMHELDRQNLFKIKSGRVPPELQTLQNSLHSSRHSSSRISSNQSSRNVNSISFRGTENEQSQTLLTLDRLSNNSLNNQIRSLRREMNIESSSKFKDFLGGVRHRCEPYLPFILCALFMTELLLSSYSSMSCRFLTCNIGFSPFNVNIQQNEIDIGFWSFYSKSKDGSMQCLRYPEDFGTMFIKGDSAWEASRWIGITNISISSFAFLILTLIVGYKAQHFIMQSSSNSRLFRILETRWKDCCLFCSVLMFILEIVKLVFMHIDICSKDKWMNMTGEMVAGKGCNLSIGGILMIVTLVLDATTILILAFSERSEETLQDMMPLSYPNDLNYDEESIGRMSMARQRSEKEKRSDSSGSSRRLNSESSVSQSFRNHNDSLTSLNNQNGSFRTMNNQNGLLDMSDQNDSFDNVIGVSQMNQEVTNTTSLTDQVQENLERNPLNSSTVETMGDTKYLNRNEMESNEDAPIAESYQSGETNRDKLHDGNEYNRSNRAFSIHSDVDEDSGMPEPLNTMKTNDAQEPYRDLVHNGNIYSRSSRKLVRNSIGFHSNVDEALGMPST